MVMSSTAPMPQSDLPNKSLLVPFPSKLACYQSYQLLKYCNYYYKAAVMPILMAIMYQMTICNVNGVTFGNICTENYYLTLQLASALSAHCFGFKGAVTVPIYVFIFLLYLHFFCFNI